MSPTSPGRGHQRPTRRSPSPTSTPGDGPFSLLTQVVGRAGRRRQARPSPHPDLQAGPRHPPRRPDPGLHRPSGDRKPLRAAGAPALHPRRPGGAEQPRRRRHGGAAEEFVRCLDTPAGITPSSIKGPSPRPSTRPPPATLAGAVHEATPAGSTSTAAMAHTSTFAPHPLARTVQIDLDVDPTTIA